jgi:hypothetical protein
MDLIHPLRLHQRRDLLRQRERAARPLDLQWLRMQGIDPDLHAAAFDPDPVVALGAAPQAREAAQQRRNDGVEEVPIQPGKDDSRVPVRCRPGLAGQWTPSRRRRRASRRR